MKNITADPILVHYVTLCAELLCIDAIRRCEAPMPVPNDMEYINRDPLFAGVTALLSGIVSLCMSKTTHHILHVRDLIIYTGLAVACYLSDQTSKNTDDIMMMSVLAIPLLQIFSSQTPKRDSKAKPSDSSPEKLQNNANIVPLEKQEPGFVERIEEERKKPSKKVQFHPSVKDPNNKCRTKHQKSDKKSSSSCKTLGYGTAR